MPVAAGTIVDVGLVDWSYNKEIIKTLFCQCSLKLTSQPRWILIQNEFSPSTLETLATTSTGAARLLTEILVEVRSLLYPGRVRVLSFSRVLWQICVRVLSSFQGLWSVISSLHISYLSTPVNCRPTCCLLTSDLRVNQLTERLQECCFMFDNSREG